MQILRVTQRLYPDVTGGGAYHAHALSRDQVKKGHDVTVLTVRTDDQQPHTEERDGYTIIRCDPAVTPLGNEIAPGVIRRLLSTTADVIHAHSHLYFSTNLAALRRWMGSVPLAITNHGLISQTAPERLFKLYLQTLGRWTFNQADIIFCYTDVDQERLRSHGITAPVEVIPNGVNTEQFTPTGSESDLIGHDGPVALFVGRLVKGKRVNLAIEAIDQVDEGLDAHFYICGDGPLREELQRVAGESVTFLGTVPYGDMAGIYRAADVLILPSRQEGTPRTIMEALSSGVPVVSSDLPQIRSAFGDSINYVSPVDSDALAEQITKVIQDNKVPTLSDRFRWEQTVDDVTAVLEELATRNSSNIND